MNMVDTEKLSAIQLDQKISDLISSNNLKKHNNPFFITADLVSTVSPDQAGMIAFNWTQITKTFMFTAIQGLGVLAGNLLKEQEASRGALTVLQTALCIISDDLSNVHPLFKKMAPSGCDGIHYKWWQDSILAKLKPLATAPLTLYPNTLSLVNKMEAFAKDKMGAPVQLRVVECIAIDIAGAFLSIFNKVESQGKLIFPDDESKAWIISHVKAECVHDAQACSSLSGMSIIAETPEEQTKMLSMVDDYCKSWALALSEFAQFIN
jgi:hypothetical protein